jgi:D-glycero-alpha-D-manno-heptose 1-phosphate guanylyltransferase
LEAIILAGGFGTRLQGIVQDMPKSMALINGKPFLGYLLNYLTGQGITKVIVAAGYRHEMIRDHFGDRFKHLSLVYSVEEDPLGTGGGIKLAMNQAETQQVFVLNGDSLFRIDLGRLMQLHIGSEADITIGLRSLEDTTRYGCVSVDAGNRVTGFTEKGVKRGSGYINGGIYLIRKEYLMNAGLPDKFSIEHDCFEKLYNSARIYGCITRGYFLDIGIPEDYYRAQDEFKVFDD